MVSKSLAVEINSIIMKMHHGDKLLFLLLKKEKTYFMGDRGRAVNFSVFISLQCIKSSL